MYVPNPSCKDFPKYEWIGQIMGAALRGKEFLVSFQPRPCDVTPQRELLALSCNLSSRSMGRLRGHTLGQEVFGAKQFGELTA